MQTFNGVSGFDDFPLQNFTAPPILLDNYVIVNSVTVLDSMVDTAAGLNPTASTAKNGGGGNGGGGGGSFGLLSLLCLLVFGRSSSGFGKR